MKLVKIGKLGREISFQKTSIGRGTSSYERLSQHLHLSRSVVGIPSTVAFFLNKVPNHKEFFNIKITFHG